MLRFLEKKLGKKLIHVEISHYASNHYTLDLGCGGSPLANVFPHRVGVDINKDFCPHIVADAHHLPFRLACFDQIVCSEVLEHLPYPKQAVQEMARVLSENGRLVLSVPFVYPIHEAPHDYHRFTVYGLQRLFGCWFDIEEIKEIFDEEQTLAILLQRIAFQRKDSRFQHVVYLIIAYLVFNFFPRAHTPRFRRIRHSLVEGPFLTAGYLLVARRK